MVVAYEPDKESAPLAVPRGKVDPKAQLAQYQTDRRSVYLGGLPHDMTEAAVGKMCESFGRILSIRFFKKRYTGGSGKFSVPHVRLT